MPSAEDKQRRKEIQNKLREDDVTRKLAELPMPKEMLPLFFDYLDQQLTAHSCDDTLRFTQQFAEEHQLAFEPIKAWLSNYGGYCDCEASANVEEHFEGP